MTSDSTQIVEQPVSTDQGRVEDGRLRWERVQWRPERGALAAGLVEMLTRTVRPAGLV